MFIRKEVNANKSWKFEGTFNDYQEPDMLHSLLNWIIKGFKRCVASRNREPQSDTAVKNITQLICQNLKVADKSITKVNLLKM